MHNRSMDNPALQKTDGEQMIKRVHPGDHPGDNSGETQKTHSKTISFI
jgi:hypothetical protein